MEYHHSLQDAVMEYHLQEERDIEASSSSSSPDSPTRESIINQIESIFTALSTALSTTAAPLQLSLVPRRNTPSFFSSSSNPTLTPTTVSFPQNARRFACILKLLDTMHATLTASQPPRTKRDIFYQRPALFQHQRTVDRLTDDLAATLHVPRSALGVVASAKGMLYGDVTLGGRSFLVDGGSVLIPGALHGAGVGVGAGVAWVLVVEKEAVFRSLACGGGGRDGGGGVVVTGKGYPDVATREAVRALQDADAGRLVLGAVVDWDPDGVEILGTYRFGSGAMGWERGRLAAERVEWWGVRSADLEVAVARGGGGGGVDGVLRLTARDRRKARGVLGRAWMADVPEWRRELQVMLFLGVKAETEIVSGVGMRAWVEGKIAARMGAGV